MYSASLILMYHDIVPEGASVEVDRAPYALGHGDFERQLSAIVASNIKSRTVAEWALGTSDPAAGVARGSALMLTFDDGDASNYTRAFPLMATRGLKATFFVTVGQIGHSGFLTWPQVLEMHRAGMEIGSHTLTHRPPRLLSESELRYEVEESKRRLEDHLGAPVVSISSPTGFFNPTMSAMAHAAGYAALCCGRIGTVHDRTDRFALPRVSIKRGMALVEFERILRFDRSILGALRAKQMARDTLKRALGYDLYLRIRARLLAWRTV